MKCRKCRLEFKRALELFNGDIVCPRCFKSLTPGEDDFAVGEEEEADFKLSETYYLSYLELASRPEAYPKEKEKRNKKIETYRKKALEYCERAANAYHPEAIVDMGYYYYKGYVSLGQGGFGRFRTAYRYFMGIIDRKNNNNIYEVYSKYYSLKGEKMPAEAAKEKVRMILGKAVNYMKDMYLSAPSEFVSNRKGNIYGVDATNKKLGEELAGLNFDYKIVRDETAKALSPKIDSLIEILKTCTQKSAARTPIFGMYEVTQSDVMRLREFMDNLRSADRGSLLCALEGERNNGAFDFSVFYDDPARVFAGAKKVIFCFCNKNSSAKNMKRDISSGALGANFSKTEAGLKNIASLFDPNGGEELSDIVQGAFNGKDARGNESYLFYIDDAYLLFNKLMESGDTTAEAFLSLLNEKYKD
ncbi:MAG: hypothetical protein LUD29_06475 [Clostridia bacterium]|nr:hypothetical protein [Clostridia bacterium]